ncbi:hypothetical protein PIB30_100940 [Stylosanthes scabra]|uniref:Uncharacterized protein n=1 Tax=Stylosanthes scabra TaxID=79078 RepID=A0ABU6UZP7_9FABA|nr:hypothetical protein [Stylosanthes scabra]
MKMECNVKLMTLKEPLPLRSSQASVPDEPVEAADRECVNRDGLSYNLSGVWQSQSSSPSS